MVAQAYNTNLYTSVQTLRVHNYLLHASRSPATGTYSVQSFGHSYVHTRTRAYAHMHNDSFSSFRSMKESQGVPTDSSSPKPTVSSLASDSWISHYKTGLVQHLIC